MATLTTNSKQIPVVLLALTEPRRQHWRVPGLGGEFAVLPGRIIPGSCAFEVDPKAAVDTGQQGVLVDDDGERWTVVTESININVTTSSATVTVTAVVFGNA